MYFWSPSSKDDSLVPSQTIFPFISEPKIFLPTSQILGASSKAVNKKLYARILKDNPLGQDDQQTPMGIIRRVD